MLTIEGKNIYT